MNHIIMSLGSNINQQKNLATARMMIERLFTSAVFTEAIWTEPIGIQSDNFLNCLCRGECNLPLDNIKYHLKKIESQIGRTQEDTRNGIIAIDIDILQFNDSIFHERDWQRDYIKKLMKNISL